MEKCHSTSLSNCNYMGVLCVDELMVNNSSSGNSVNKPNSKLKCLTHTDWLSIHFCGFLFLKLLHQWIDFPHFDDPILSPYRLHRIGHLTGILTSFTPLNLPLQQAVRTYYPLHRRFSWQLRLSELWRSRNWSPTKAAGRWSWVMTRSGSWSGRVPGSCFIRLFCTTFSGIRSKPILGGGTKLIRFFTSLLFAVLFSFVPPWVLDINWDKDDVLCDVRLKLVRNGVEACYTLKNFGIFSVCCFRYCYLPVEKSDF